MSTTSGTREFTGRHMLAIMVAFFSVIIAVNLTMAMFARSSWTGIVAENTYVASQKFNEISAEGRAQAALGWTSELVVTGSKVSYRLVDKAGNVVAAKRAVASFRRPAYEAEDQNVVLTPQADGSLSSPIELRDGLWIVEIHAEAGLAHPYRDTRRLTLRDGLIR